MKINLPTMLRAAADFIEQRGQFRRNAASLSTVANASAVAHAAPAALDLSGCKCAADAERQWRQQGQPELPCSPQELYWRGQPAHLRPAYWQDDVI